MEAEELGSLLNNTLRPISCEKINRVGNDWVWEECRDLRRQSLQLRWLVLCDHVARSVAAIESLRLQQTEFICGRHLKVIDF